MQKECWRKGMWQKVTTKPLWHVGQLACLLPCHQRQRGSFLSWCLAHLKVNSCSSPSTPGKHTVYQQAVHKTLRCSFGIHFYLPGTRESCPHELQNTAVVQGTGSTMDWSCQLTLGSEANDYLTIITHWYIMWQLWRVTHSHTHTQGKAR